jgi:hypothetical protein
MLFLRPGRKHSKRVMLGTKASSAESSVERNISSARRHLSSSTAPAFCANGTDTYGRNRCGSMIVRRRGVDEPPFCTSVPSGTADGLARVDGHSCQARPKVATVGRFGYTAAAATVRQSMPDGRLRVL